MCNCAVLVGMIRCYHKTNYQEVAHMNVYRVMTMELGKERKWADFATFDGARSCRDNLSRVYNVQAWIICRRPANA